MNYETKYIKYKTKYMLLKNQIGGALQGDLIRYIDTKKEIGRIIDIAPTYYLVENKDGDYLEIQKKDEKILWEVFIKEFEPPIVIINDDAELSNIFYGLSKRILTKNILNKEIITEINHISSRNPDFKRYLIELYNVLFEGPEKDNSVSILANRVITKIISDVKRNNKNNSGRIPNKYIILAPGDTPSKVAAYISLIPEYTEILRDNDINIVIFPLSGVSMWDEATFIKYLKEVLTPFTEGYDKSYIYFGYLDSISRGNTRKMLNRTLRNLGYPNIIHEAELEDDPDFGFNLINEGNIFNTAEKTRGMIPNRCVPQYDKINYETNTIDERNYRNQLFNCNIYLNYWYEKRFKS